MRYPVSRSEVREVLDRLGYTRQSRLDRDIFKKQGRPSHTVVIHYLDEQVELWDVSRQLQKKGYTEDETLAAFRSVREES